MVVRNEGYAANETTTDTLAFVHIKREHHIHNPSFNDPTTDGKINQPACIASNRDEEPEVNRLVGDTISDKAADPAEGYEAVDTEERTEHPNSVTEHDEAKRAILANETER